MDIIAEISNAQESLSVCPVDVRSFPIPSDHPGPLPSQVNAVSTELRYTGEHPCYYLDWPKQISGLPFLIIRTLRAFHCPPTPNIWLSPCPLPVITMLLSLIAMAVPIWSTP